MRLTLTRVGRAAGSGAAAIATIFLLAGLPLLIATDGGRPRIVPARLLEALVAWARGIADGSSFEYFVGPTRWNYGEEALAFFSVSAANLAIPGAIGICLGSLAGIALRSRRRGWLDRGLDVLAATPDFILALAAQVFVAGALRPLGLRIPIGPSGLGLSPVALVVIGVYPLCFSFRAAARASRSLAYADFVTYARAKGLSEGEILRRHIGSGVIPAVSRELPAILSYMQGTLFIVEYLFNLPGIARFLFSAAFSGRRPGFYESYQFGLGVFVLAGLGAAFALVYAALHGALALARKALAHE